MSARVEVGGSIAAEAAAARLAPDAESVGVQAAGAAGSAVRQGSEERSGRVEAIRAIAAIGVVEYHTMFFAVAGAHDVSWLDVRVAQLGIPTIYLFFALSGYLMFRPFARRDYAGGQQVNLRSYALNRVVRLLPIYYTAVVVLLLVQERGGTSEEWWRFLTFSQAYSLHTLGKVDGPTWTLVIELQFYILLPLLALVLARASGGNARVAGALLAGIGLASFALHAWTFDPLKHPLSHWSFPANFAFIVVGMLLGMLEVRWRKAPPDLPAWAMSSGLWLATGAVLWVFIPDMPDDSLAVVASFLVVGSVVLPLRPSRLMSVLDWRPLAAIGVTTYSLYIWHLPLLERIRDMGWLPYGFWTDNLIAIPVCVAAALISFRLVEAPFLRLRRRWAPTTFEAEVARARAAGSAPRPAISPRGRP